MDGPPLASLSLTHVHYDPTDPISHLAAWLSLLPQGLCVTYATLLWATREVEVALMFAGQLGCEALNFALKRLIREERPKLMLGKGYGMPSSHAQFLAYFAVYLSLFLLLRHRPLSQPTKSSSSSPPIPLPHPHTQLRLLAILVAVVAGAVAGARVYLSYHTPRQVLAGVAAGVTCAVLWFAATAVLRGMGLVEWGLATGLARQFRLRDLVCQEDLVEAGWREWERRREEKEREGEGRKER